MAIYDNILLQIFSLLWLHTTIIYVIIKSIKFMEENHYEKRL